MTLKVDLRDIMPRSATLFGYGYSGSAQYGWTSPTSDIDVRGVFTWDTHRLLGLNPPRKRAIKYEEGLNDFSFMELSHAIHLCIEGKCTVIELANMKTIETTDEWEKIRGLILNDIPGEKLVNSYFGMANSSMKRFDKTHETKAALYAYRALFAADHYMKTGKIEPNLGILLKEYPEKDLPEYLLRQKIIDRNEVKSQKTRTDIVNEVNSLKETLNDLTIPAVMVDKPELMADMKTSTINLLENELIKIRKQTI